MPARGGGGGGNDSRPRLSHACNTVAVVRCCLGGWVGLKGGHRCGLAAWQHPPPPPFCTWLSCVRGGPLLGTSVHGFGPQGLLATSPRCNEPRPYSPPLPPPTPSCHTPAAPTRRGHFRPNWQLIRARAPAPPPHTHPGERCNGCISSCFYPPPTRSSSTSLDCMPAKPLTSMKSRLKSAMTSAHLGGEGGARGRGWRGRLRAGRRCRGSGRVCVWGGWGGGRWAGGHAGGLWWWWRPTGGTARLTWRG